MGLSRCSLQGYTDDSACAMLTQSAVHRWRSPNRLTPMGLITERLRELLAKQRELDERMLKDSQEMLRSVSELRKQLEAIEAPEA